MKQAYYFPHFCNSRRDKKIQRIEMKFGIEGYAIYFKLLEVLREETNLKYNIQDIDILANEFKTSIQKIETIIKKYELFKIDESGYFYSEKLIEYLQPFFKASEIARQKAKKRWTNTNIIPPALSQHSTSILIAKKNKKKYLDFVYLADNEYEKLKIEFGEDITKEKISALNNYIGSRGKKYKSHYHTILNWARMNDSKNEKLEVSIENEKTINEIIEYLNKKINTKYEPSYPIKKIIYDRIKDGRILKDFKILINYISNKWLNDSKMSEYLKPSTIFNQEKFENYLGLARKEYEEYLNSKENNMEDNNI